MAETLVSQDRDLRAGRFLSSLRSGRGFSPEQLGRLAGISGSTIRDIEVKGVIPHLSTQEKLAAFFAVEKESIWRRQRRSVPKGLRTSKRALTAVEAAAGCLVARTALTDAPDPFLFGVAWAVVRAQDPFASPDVIATRALAAGREHGAADPARASA